jgi:CYTH domain-containing protein
MSPRGVEIERKFRLRAAPNPEVLAAHGAVAKRIEQVYLRRRAPTATAGEPSDAAHPVDASDGVGRVRRTELADGSVSYRSNTKRRVGAFAFDEHEEAIGPAEWAAALERADPDRRPVRKIRHVVAHGAQSLEIDVFEEPSGLVVVEVELRSEDEAVELPAWLGEWREVTGDHRYFNASLARRGAEVPPFD